MLDIFHGVATRSRDVYKSKEQIEAYDQLALYRLAFDRDSAFLDIGSGIGKVVI